MTRRRAGLLAALALASACGPGRLVRQGTVNDELVARMQRRLAVVRGLDFRRPVPTRALGAKEIAAVIEDEMARSIAPAERERADLVYAQLGLVPAGTRLEPAMERLFTTQLAAFYDPRTKSLAVSTEAIRRIGAGPRWQTALTGRDVVGELMVAHELTHALQDQHWGLPVDPEPLVATHTDRLLARRALLEGDATWAAFATVTGGPLDEATRTRVLRQLDALPAQLAASVPDVPPLLRDTLAFQYRDGTRFVDQLLARGGWPAVDRAQADPPVSSEQVLHPERYLAAKRDVPTSITVTGVERLGPLGFTAVLDDTLGELVIRVLAGRMLPPEQAARVAEGWDGDRLIAFARGPDLVVVWMSVWDSEADGVEFADALARENPAAHVERRGVRVLALVGPWPPELPAALWAGATSGGS